MQQDEELPTLARVLAVYARDVMLPAFGFFLFCYAVLLVLSYAVEYAGKELMK